MPAARSLGPRIAAVLVVIAVLVTTFAAFGIDDGGDDVATTTTTTIAVEDLGAEARQLVELLDRAREQTYHARYEGTSPDTPDATIRLETWQAPPLVRQDSELVIGGQPARTSSFVLPDGGVRCTQLADAPWTCREAAEGELRSDVVSDAVLARLQESEVRARQTKVDDVDVTCFSLTVEGSASELCLDERGITVRVRSSGSELRRIVLDDALDDSVFEPPADIDAG